MGALIFVACSHAPTSQHLQSRWPAGDGAASYSCASRVAGETGTIDNPVRGEQYCVEIFPSGTPNAGQFGPEEEILAALGDEINSIQDQVEQELSQAGKGNDIHRGFHAKHHGCLTGVMTVKNDLALPKEANPGIFIPGQSYKILARFSNAANQAQADTEVDARGFAVKVLGTADDGPISASEPLAKNQDFLMTNQPTANGRDAFEFMDFAVANVKGKVALAEFLALHPAVFKVLLNLKLHQSSVESMATESYWAKTPFRLGPKLAVKFLVRPVPSVKQFSRNKHKGPAFLREDLIRRAAAEPIRFKFYIQLQGDPVAFPVEDGLQPWDENVSVPLEVADIKFMKQDFTADARQAYCEKVSMDPWHHLTDHEPIGNLNRARRIVYGSSAGHRHAELEEPSIAEVESIFGPITDPDISAN